jgi:TonB family protein
MSGSNAPKSQASPAVRDDGSSQERVIHACVVQAHKIIEDARLESKKTLSIGTDVDNTFSIYDPKAPKQHALIVFRGTHYELVVGPQMKAELASSDTSPYVDLETLKKESAAHVKGQHVVVPLTHHHRGKVWLGDTQVLFHFVPALSPLPIPPLPAEIKANLWRDMDRTNLWSFVGVFLFHVAVIGYLFTLPKPEPLTLEKVDDRWAKLLQPELKIEERRKPEEAKQEGDASKEKKEDKAPKEDKAEKKEEAPAEERPKAEKKEAIRNNLKSKGILAVLGTVGEGSGAVADVFSQGLGTDLDKAFDGVSGVGVAKDGEVKGSRGDGSGTAASIGGLETSGGGKVGLEAKKEAKVSGAVETAEPEVDGSLDSAAITKVVRTRMRMVQDCYEKELKKDSSLSGKIEIEFTIGEDGRVTEVRVASNKMGSNEVAECIVSRIKSWRFPKPDGGSVTVNYPFIFTASK